MLTLFSIVIKGVGVSEVYLPVVQDPHICQRPIIAQFTREDLRSTSLGFHHLPIMCGVSTSMACVCSHSLQIYPVFSNISHSLVNCMRRACSFQMPAACYVGMAGRGCGCRVESVVAR